MSGSLLSVLNPRHAVPNFLCKSSSAQMKMSMLPSFLDFEASSLSSDSYPIEVAWNVGDGSIESHLISPEGIDRWTDWSVISEKVHGIPRDDLIAHGKRPNWICSLMNDQLAGQIVYSDNPLFDGLWLKELFSVVEEVQPNFRLGLADEITFGNERPGRPMPVVAHMRIQDLKAEARRRVGGQHRAKLDVQYLIELYNLANENNSSTDGR